MKTERGEKSEAKPADILRKPGPRRGREHSIRGIPVSPGIAIGTVYDTTEVPTEAPRRTITPDQAEAEKARLAEAVALSRKQLA